jgi:tetratricopeptide (TPR) repeat protein
MRRILVCLALLGLAVAAGCTRGVSTGAGGGPPDSCALALARHEGDGRVDREIRGLQSEARNPRGSLVRTYERLGWLYVSKARSSFVPGYYMLAELCADCFDTRGARSPEALLLRGHILHNLHRFKEAELAGRAAVEVRGSAFDHGLLGDALMEQGRLAEAAASYQRMLDLRPSLQSYSRAAHLRWLKGDLPGALELERMAAGAGSPRDPESLAWVTTRLATYELQAGDLEAALRSCDGALAFQPDYAPALLARGRIHLARGRHREAVRDLERAAGLNPLPEYWWALAEALRAQGSMSEAAGVEAELARQGAASDPRTYAVYLATRRADVATALRLAEEELRNRSDVFTLDALAWAQSAAGNLDAARLTMRRALGDGTRDARLFYHAGVIARASGRTDEARQWLRQASRMAQTLLPSEREQLAQHLSAL